MQPFKPLIVFLVLFHANSVPVFCDKVVLFYPVSPSSHYLTVSVLTDELTRRGHSVYVVKWKEEGRDEVVGYGVPVTNPATNFTTRVTTLTMDGRDGRFFVLTKEKEAGFIYPTKFMWEPGLTSSAVLFRHEWANYFTFLEAHCDTLLSNHKLIQKLKSERFDLAIVDMTWNECSIALARDLKIKSVVGFWLSTPSSLEPDLSTTFLASSHLSIFRAKLAPTSVIDRLYNIFAKITSQLVMKIYFYHIDRSIGRYLPRLKLSAQELQKGVDGMLINDHLALGTPNLMPPNYVNVGGLQISVTNPRELPQEINDWLDDAPQGVIFFSFGSRLGIGGAPTWIRQTFLQALQTLPQKVLVQLESSLDFELRVNGSLPANVKTFDWIPQQSVLVHQNVRLFITHGGLQSALESIYAGVPMVVFPVVHDAPETSSKLVAKGIAVELDRYGVTTNSVVRAVNQVLRDPTYKKNAKALSSIMRHEMKSPLRQAADFLEYLLVHGSTPHLKIPNVHAVSVVQYFHLDVLTLLAMIVGCVILAGKYTARGAQLAFRLMFEDFSKRHEKCE